MENDRLPYLREKTKSLTGEPGCYIMRDKQGEIIYIGKAKNLKKRVTSYFRANADHLPKVEKMVSHVYDYDYIVTSSEFEALVLECSLIKQNTPKYNILLKDDKGYHYIKITSKKWGRITAAKQIVDDGAEYIGPYVSSFAVKQAVEEANTAFMLPTCGRRFPQDFRKERPCLNYHIKRCMGVCMGRISEQDYSETLSQALCFLRDDSAGTIKLLTQKMEQAAEVLDFERAAKLRDRINAINKINEHQKVIYNATPDEDIIALSQDLGQVCAVVLKFRNHKLVDKDDYMLGETEGLPQARSEFLLRYYSGAREIPSRLALDGETEDTELIAQYLTECLGKKCTVVIPQKGEQMRLVEMARQNAAELLSQRGVTGGREVAALDELARLLGLPHPPQYIEAYDISNIGSSSMVAGMVVFKDGKPYKQSYKRFSIKTITEQNDYAAMSEVIERRLNRYTEEQGKNDGFGRLPDLILLDGGRGHVSTIRPIVASMGFDIPVFGMVKDDHHRTRGICSDTGELTVAAYKNAFSLIVKLQNEVHRFSIDYQRTRHKMTNLETALTSIEGVGKVRAGKLYKHFKSMRSISEASVNELCAAEGMTGTAALAVYNYFHKTDKKDEK